MNDPENLPSFLRPTDGFVRRHIGPDREEIREMLLALELDSMDELIDQTIPSDIRCTEPLDLGPPRGESELLAELEATASLNVVMRSCIGMGYYDCLVPPVIQRNILENPGWYTQYTPYQAEISQGRLEALLNFQTMVSDLCALPLSNASLLDEATAAAEAMNMCFGAARHKRHKFFVSDRCHPQTVAVVRTRAESLGLVLVVDDAEHQTFDQDFCGALMQYPGSDGEIRNLESLVERIHEAGGIAVVATDLLALTLLRPPGEFGADIAVGSAQRFGVPLGFGGPHAAFMAATEAFRRLMPGRIIGVSRDAQGDQALRMALQTREQHIRRDKATSNICTAQVLLAVMSGMYAVYHGPEGLKAIATRVRALTRTLAMGLAELGYAIMHAYYFDTIRVRLPDRGAELILGAARARGFNLRSFAHEGDEHSVGISLDETTTVEDVEELLAVFEKDDGQALSVAVLARDLDLGYIEPHGRTSSFLEHPIFNAHHSEHELLRYMHHLQERDLSMTRSMIALGSCTMKLNGTSEMLPVSWQEFNGLHPFAPPEQTEGYRELFQHLEHALREITGFAGVSLQPNAGAQGEYAGLLVIRAFHLEHAQPHRTVCLIPVSAHGTNPASAVLAGMEVVPVACDEGGNIDVADLTAKAEAHAERLAALMVTYPSTHGVFEESIRQICDTIHRCGGQVYMDGANMNAQVGLCRPGDFGADVCHLNLHKTFCIPHGGGGPGMGPIAVAEHLVRFLPGHPVVPIGGDHALGVIAAAPWGSPSILTISHVYIALMGSEGLTQATGVAILNANYMKHRLESHFEVLYTGARGRVGHEFIIDLRPFEGAAGVTVEDVAKRLMDFGFHAPTMSFPVAGTLMIEPTESETKAELDRLCDALIAIRAEIRNVEEGKWTREDNPLKHAPHTAAVVTADEWAHAYSREEAAYPAPWIRGRKFWPAVGRVDNGYGDRNLVCTCPPVEAWTEPDPEAQEMQEAAV